MRMNLCSDDHDEICFEGSTCPPCDALIDLKKLEGQLSDAEDEIRSLNKALDDKEGIPK